MRSSTGISNLPVSEEIDPGFGPDTEQRRVEFASKLEEEAFSISVGDATTLARSNLITALKLWDKKNIIKIVSDLDLYDIMLIWLIFDICYIVEVLGLLKQDEIKKVLSDKKTWEKFTKNILQSLDKDISRRIVEIDINLSDVIRIRENMGGDLIFSLKNKNIYEIYKIYEMTYSKLSKSLRDTFSNMITVVDIGFKSIKKVISSNGDLLEKFILLACKNVRSRYQLLGKKVENISTLIDAFSEEAGKMFIGFFHEGKESGDTDVKKQVKRFYGIDT